jgi:UMF1 family MFS transporter
MPSQRLIYCTILAPFCGVIGNFFFFYLQKVLRTSSKTMLMIILLNFVLICVYAGAGIFTDVFGLHHEWEMYMMASFYGFLIGAMQSFARVIFAELVPLGEESEFFSLYAITDKGASWVGPLIQAMATQWLPDQRYGVVLLGIMILASFPILIWGFDPMKGKEEANKFSRLIPRSTVGMEEKQSPK